jgi:hypothetical protein
MPAEDGACGRVAEAGGAADVAGAAGGCRTAGMVPEGGRTPGDNEGAPGAFTAGIDAVDGAFTAGIDAVDGAFTAGIDAVEGLFDAAGAAGILTTGLLVDDGRAAGAGALVATTVFGGSGGAAGTARAGVSDACVRTLGPLIDGGGTESST